MKTVAARSVRFDRPREVTDYMEDGQPFSGNETNGTILPHDVLTAFVASRTNRQPCEYLVIGEEWPENGKHYLDFGTSRAFIEATTHYRHERDGLRWVCPECGERSGIHRKTCGFR